MGDHVVQELLERLPTLRVRRRERVENVAQERDDRRRVGERHLDVADLGLLATIQVCRRRHHIRCPRVGVPPEPGAGEVRTDLYQ
jgi:hypothetical protein